MRITAASHLLALVCVAIAGSCSSASPARSRSAPEPQRTSVVLRDWPVGLRPSHAPEVEEEVAEPEAPIVEEAEPEPIPTEDAGVEPDGDAGVGDGGPAIAVGPSCDEVVAHVVQWMKEEMARHVGNDGEMLAIMEKVIQQVGETMRTHCVEDGWSEAARTCFLHASSQPELEACKQHLTPEQDQRMKDAMNDVKP
jgi:hypothetical protein